VHELGVEPASIAQWFAEELRSSYVLVRVSEDYAAAWSDVLGVPVRRCYIDDELLEKQAAAKGRPKSEIVAAVLPDPGPIMAGDFGEILVFLYHAAVVPDAEIAGPKKWRLKQDRTKPAPYSDVIQFVLPNWPEPSTDDRLLCAEVKTKSTTGAFQPVTEAIEGCEKDRISRLARTLVWLKERALSDEKCTTDLEILERFAMATDYPEAQKQFRAIAVVSASFVEDVIASIPEEEPTGCSIIVIAVPQLKQHYEDVYDAVHATVAEPGGAT